MPKVTPAIARNFGISNFKFHISNLHWVADGLTDLRTPDSYTPPRVKVLPLPPPQPITPNPDESRVIRTNPNFENFFQRALPVGGPWTLDLGLWTVDCGLRTHF